MEVVMEVVMEMEVVIEMVMVVVEYPSYWKLFGVVDQNEKLY